MAIETICQKCSARLRVGDEHAGKLARCPQCQAVYTVPSPDGRTIDRGTTNPVERWRMKSPDGAIYGPVSRQDLDRWLAEGRITSQSQLVREGSEQWQWASQVYPQLGPAYPTGSPSNIPSSTGSPFAPSAARTMTSGTLTTSPATLSGQNPFSESAASANPYSSPMGGSYYNPAAAGYYAAHHGVAVLVLGLLSLMVCGILGIPALIMGNSDLRQMNAGRMDPSGRGLVITGMVLGGIATAIMALVFVFYAIAILAAIAGG